MTMAPTTHRSSAARPLLARAGPGQWCSICRWGRSYFCICFLLSASFIFLLRSFVSCVMRPLRRFYALLSSIRLALCFVSSLFSRSPSYDSPSLFLYFSSHFNFEVHDSLHEQNPHSNFDIIMNIMSASGT